MKARYLFGLAITLSFLTIWGLRLNFIKAHRLAASIEAKDLAAQDVAPDIMALRRFSFSHMNASVKFELAGSYQRALIAANAAGQPTGELYAQAQAACGREVGTNSVAQVACVQDFLARRLNPNQTTKLKLPNQLEYKYAFASPGWAPDMAGLSLLISLILALSGLTLYIRNLFRLRQSL